MRSIIILLRKIIRVRLNGRRLLNAWPLARHIFSVTEGSFHCSSFPSFLNWLNCVRADEP